MSRILRSSEACRVEAPLSLVEDGYFLDQFAMSVMRLVAKGKKCCPLGKNDPLGRDTEPCLDKTEKVMQQKECVAFDRGNKVEEARGNKNSQYNGEYSTLSHFVDEKVRIFKEVRLQMAANRSIKRPGTEFALFRVTSHADAR
jgi:hypothetical protein